MKDKENIRLSVASLLPIDLLSTPFSHAGVALPVITLKNLHLAADDLENYIRNQSAESLEKGSVLHWLTQCLDCAVKEMNSEAAIRTGQVMVMLAVKHTDSLLQMLDKTIEFGPFKGQNTAFVWMTELYLATFGTRNDEAILAVNFVMNHLLAHGKEPLEKSLLFRCLKGDKEGENGLYVLAKAISQLSLDAVNNSPAIVLTMLLSSLMAQLPEASDSDVLVELRGGILLRGKHTLYMLVTILKEAAVHNPAVVDMICSILGRIIANQNINHPDSAFFKCATFGESRGLSSAHLLLTALVSAAYIKENDDAIKALSATLVQLILVAPNQMSMTFTQNIIRDRRANTNGVSLLVQSLVAATEHELDIRPITDVFIRLIETGSDLMISAFKDPVVLDAEGSITISPLKRLIETANTVRKDHDYSVMIHHITGKLAGSPFCEELRASLPRDLRAFFKVDASKKLSDVEPEAAAGASTAVAHPIPSHLLLFTSGPPRSKTSAASKSHLSEDSEGDKRSDRTMILRG